MPATGKQNSSDKPRKRSDSRQRQAQVAVRLNPAEFNALKAVAAREGRSLACALREGFLRYAAEAG
jgi:hypothetical protein